MKGIQVFDENTKRWIWCKGYVGLTDAEAKAKLKMLCAWAKEDDSSARYRIREGRIDPV
jgi:hypothetical protein